MPADRAATSLKKRRGLACLPGSEIRCKNCENAKVDCKFLEKTPHEQYLERYTTELEDRIQQLEGYIQAQALTSRQHQAGPEHTQPSQRRPHSADGREGGENLATGVGFLSLNAGAEPVYLGGSSGVGWATVLMQSMRQKFISAHPRVPRPPLGNPVSPQSSNDHSVSLPPPPSEAIGNHYISTVYVWIQSRYGFLDWVAIQRWQANATELCVLQPLQWKDGGLPEDDKVKDCYGAFFLWMIYGLGAKLCERDPHVPHASHEVYYNAALAHFSPLSTYQSISTVQALLLLVVYMFRHTSSGLNLWHAGGIAIRSAIELGLHRRIKSVAARERDPRAYCMRQRVFWGAYILDRMISIQFGRPFAVQDRDIDIELPVNLDANVADHASLCSLLSAQSAMLETMTSFIHTIRLNQIKTKIHELVYTVDHASPPDQHAVNELLDELEAWKATYPAELDSRVPACSQEFFDLEYHNSVQILLRPLCAKKDAALYFLHRCATSAGAVLDIECQLLRRDSKNLATWVLAKIFMSGLTLLHVVWNYPDVLSPSVVARALRSCSTCLFIYAQQFPAADSYHDCFEDLVKVYDERKDHAPSSNTATRTPRSGSNTERYDGLHAHGNVWTDKLDDLGGSIPGLSEDLATFMSSIGFTQGSETQASFVDPATAQYGNMPGLDSAGAEMLWDLPFDSWNGNQDVNPSFAFASLFEQDQLPMSDETASERRTQ
ncbi:hypothetical protein I350_03291 [Cryptococcus amylolentus CBS 6273]|uniref:Xylanolytic transcriptional activator regulatory domain-containing protein n=1 Tax=Cryptococcus amylolentus CBS 6273 TaxID=1296118 RepID=A0A1E3K5D2_9TREE|nr:hypothetical protein I350_03291 [Cryptococcus amylolentus CBS 6273]